MTRYSTGEVELYDLATDPWSCATCRRVARYADVLADLKRLYQEYADCGGGSVRADLPAKYRVSATESRRITRAQQRAIRIYFGS